MKKYKKQLSLFLALVMLFGLIFLPGCGSQDQETGSAGGSARSFTVTFDLNGGELVSGKLVQSVRKGRDATPPEAVNGDKILSWDGDWETILEDVTITAVWTDPPSYTVRFDPNGGELVSGKLSQTVKEGGSAVPPEVANGDQLLTWDGNWENVTADTVITARWEEPPRPVYTVTFDLNGGELISGELNQTVREGESAVPPEAVRGRMELSWEDGWQNVSADTTVAARWTRIAMDTADLAEYVQERTVTVNVKTIDGTEGTGTGFFIDSKGTILTNFHVIDGASSITVEAISGATYPVKRIVDFSNLYDLAVLQIDISESPYLEFSETPIRTGENVYAVGSALGVLTGSFTAGIVSSTRRSHGMIDCIQMDAAISPGNSGGPLVNIYGEVVGINTASYIYGENLNLAIKPETLEKLSMDKNWTVSEYKAWYEQEISRCWTLVISDGNGGKYYDYSLVYTFQHVTGVECRSSNDIIDANTTNSRAGYYQFYDYYVYDYSTSAYDQYVDYLKSVGFVYDSREDFNDGTSYYYYNDKDGILIDLFITSDSSVLWIFPEG